MSEYVWADMRDPFIERVGSAPSAAIEQRIIDVFEKQPKLVELAIAHVGLRFEQGLIRSPWPVLAQHVEETREAQGKAREVRASDASGRVKAREQGQRWIRSTGVHFDREHEVEDELFGMTDADTNGELLKDSDGRVRRFGGLLPGYADDAELRDELLALWAAERPRGAKSERESIERQAKLGGAYRAQLALSKPMLPAMAEAEPGPKLGDVPVDAIDAALRWRVGDPIA